MRICILECEDNNGVLLERFGPFSAMFENWLRPHLPDAEFHAVNLIDGTPAPHVRDFDGYLVTGSIHGVYDDLPWMAGLVDLLQAARIAGVPVTGVCFGHQIMAHAYGGRVEKSDFGWQIGRRQYVGPRAYSGLAFHQDQVVALPDGAVVTTGHAQCPVAGLSYEHAVSVQFHPEFSPDFVAAILDKLQGDTVPQAVADAARVGLTDPVDADKVAQWFANVLRGR